MRGAPTAFPEQPRGFEERFGQARAINSSFEIASPARSVSAAKISSARPPMHTGFPSSDSMR
jgi:hypothetical protein